MSKLRNISKLTRIKNERWWNIPYKAQNSFGIILKDTLGLSSPIQSKDLQTFSKTSEQIMRRRKEHLTNIFFKSSEVDMDIIQRFPRREILAHMTNLPAYSGIVSASNDKVFVYVQKNYARLFLLFYSKRRCYLGQMFSNCLYTLFRIVCTCYFHVIEAGKTMVGTCWY